MAINISNLNKSYQNSVILEDLSVSIKEGSIFGLLGPNGAGKTTLISILNHLISKDSGKIKIYGYDFEKDSKSIKSISAYVPQTYAFYPNLTTYENLEFFGALYGLRNNKLKDRIEYCIEASSLEKFTNKRAQTYSGGVKRRLNIAVGLLNAPKIIYLDEPTVGIDPQSRKYILNILKKINKRDKTTIVYTSHYMEEIEYLCDEIAILDNKKIILQEKKDILMKQNSFVTIKLASQNLSVDINNGYKELIEVFSQIKKENQTIIDIDFGNKNLEHLFLSLTKGKLRD